MFSKIPDALNAIVGKNRVSLESAGETGEFQIYQYNNRDGSFDYDSYCRTQIGGNKRKLEKVWVQEENIFFLANYIRYVVRETRFGLCHGTRRGKEQEWFRKYLDCPVFGTEISDTAEDFPFTIRWDFHDTKPEWIDSVDFIYSNSLDHSYAPEHCLNAWMSCIRPSGVCILEHTSGHELATRLDPFGAHISRMPHLIMKWGEGRYFVRETLAAPVVPDGLEYSRFIVIQRFD